jgi:hypothetical protein
LVTLLTIHLHAVSLRISIAIQDDVNVEWVMKNEFKVLSDWFFERIEPSIRMKITRTLPKIHRRYYAGFDTEYQGIDTGVNRLLSVQLSVTGDIAIELPKFKEYDFESLHTQSQESYLTNTKLKMDRLKMDSTRVLKIINSYILGVRDLKFGDYDEKIKYYYKILKEQGFEIVESDFKSVFLIPKFPISLKMFTNENNCGLKWEELIAEVTSIQNVDLTYWSKRLLSLLELSEEQVNPCVKNVEVEDLNKLVENTEVISIKEGNLLKLKAFKPQTYEKTFERTKVRFKVKNSVYLIGHYNAADLSMISD